MGGEMLISLAAKVLVGLVFVGWLIVWIITPTQIFKDVWQPKLQEDTDSTYFGDEGANILIYSLPIFSISLVGCAYLQWKQNRSNNNMQCSNESSNSRLAFLKRPALVRGPLGIVSSMELGLFIFFLALLLWCFGCWLYVKYDAIAKGTDKWSMGTTDKLWEKRLNGAALRLGRTGHITLALLFIPVTRGSSILPLVGITSEASIRYHIWVGHITLLLFTLHSIAYVVYWISANKTWQLVEWGTTHVSNVAGEISMLFGLILWATTFPRIRRKAFELFFYTHYFYILFLFFFVLHVGFHYFWLTLPGIYLFIVDRYLRFLQSRTKVHVISARLIPGSQTTELTFSKCPGFDYGATSVVFVNIPSLSELQWHPFTMSSSSKLEPEKMTIVIKKEGNWSQKLFEQLYSEPHPGNLDVYLEGPYGPVTNHYMRYNGLVLVSGGSGITPFFSIIRDLLSLATTDIRTPSVHLICAFKTSMDLRILELLLPISDLTASDLSRLDLRIDAFVTREKQSDNSLENQVRTIWFKPSGFDTPVWPVLGRDYWAWLGLVVSISFVLFLFLLGIVYRFYIYPINESTSGHGHGHGHVYSVTWRALMGLALMLASIFLVAGVVVVWNRKKALMARSRQVLNTEGVTPTVSPGSWFYKDNKDVESLPNEYQKGATNVHFGTRPDLRKMLSECISPNTGVFVSGPRAMRSEVATICGSENAENLNFESLSFSW